MFTNIMESLHNIQWTHSLMTLRCHRAESVVRPKVKYKVVVILTNVTEGPLDSISSKGTEASSIFWPHTMTGMRW